MKRLQQTRLLPYLPGLDGLRAIAVIAVFIYHALPGWLPGGFLGVELFFVISGYIITSQLLAQWQANSAIDLLDFWHRRARRLLPAAYFLVLALLALTIIGMKEQLADLREAAPAAIVYISNWYLIFDQQSYFESWAAPSLLQHLWSLAVEEQFYLVWPLIMALFLVKLPRVLAFAIILLAAAASALLMALLYESGGETSRLYYGTDTRAAGFLVGAALAFAWRQAALHALRPRARRLAELCGLACVPLFLLFLLQIGQGSSLLYTGGFLLVSGLSAGLILAAVLPGGLLARLLGKKPMTWLGTRSYSVYLWHWPLLVISAELAVGNTVLFVLRLAGTLALAEFSYRLIEQPVRRGLIGRLAEGLRRRERVYRWAFAAPLVAAGATVAIAFIAIDAGFQQTPGWPTTVSSIRLVSLATDQQAGSKPAADTPLQTFEDFAWPPVAIAVAQPVSVAEQKAPIQPRPVLASAILSPQEKVVVLGDSVMLGAAYGLANIIPNLDLDAAVGRQASTFVELLRERAQSGGLGDYFILHAGNNGSLSRSQLEEMLSLLSAEHRVVVLNTTVPRPWQDSNNALLAKVVPQYPNAVLVDWHTASEGQRSFFASDGVHLTGAGANAMIALISEALLN